MSKHVPILVAISVAANWNVRVYTYFKVAKSTLTTYIFRCSHLYYLGKGLNLNIQKRNFEIRIKSEKSNDFKMRIYVPMLLTISDAATSKVRVCTYCKVAISTSNTYIFRCCYLCNWVQGSNLYIQKRILKFALNPEK